MAWTSISSGALAVGKPLTSTIALALRDNVGAAMNGESGAPVLFGQAVARFGNGLATLAITAAATHTLAYGMASTVGTVANATGTVTVAHSWTMTHYSGSVRMGASHQASGGATSTLVAYLNGVPQFSWATTSSSPVPITYDMPFAAGDLLQWAHYISAGSGTSTITGVYISASDAYVQQIPLIPASMV